MSQENVEVVQSVLAAFSRYQERSVLGLLDPKVVCFLRLDKLALESSINVSRTPGCKV